MVSSRTGLGPRKRFRRAVLSRDEINGVTHCPICGVLLDYRHSRQPNSAEPDHIIPIARGGSNDPTNGRTICRRCNQSKKDKTYAPSPAPRVPVRKPTTLVDW